MATHALPSCIVIVVVVGLVRVFVIIVLVLVIVLVVVLVLILVLARVLVIVLIIVFVIVLVLVLVVEVSLRGSPIQAGSPDFQVAEAIRRCADSADIRERARDAPGTSTVRVSTICNILVAYSEYSCSIRYLRHIPNVIGTYLGGSTIRIECRKYTSQSYW